MQQEMGGFRAAGLRPDKEKHKGTEREKRKWEKATSCTDESWCEPRTGKEKKEIEDILIEVPQLRIRKKPVIN